MRLPGRGVMKTVPADGAGTETLCAAGGAGGEGQYDRSGLRNVKAFRGYVQGYNAQAVVTEEQIVIAAEIKSSPRTSVISDR